MEIQIVPQCSAAWTEIWLVLHPYWRSGLVLSTVCGLLLGAVIFLGGSLGLLSFLEFQTCSLLVLYTYQSPLILLIFLVPLQSMAYEMTLGLSSSSSSQEPLGGLVPSVVPSVWLLLWARLSSWQSELNLPVHNQKFFLGTFYTSLRKSSGALCWQKAQTPHHDWCGPSWLIFGFLPLGLRGTAWILLHRQNMLSQTVPSDNKRFSGEPDLRLH